MKKILLANNYHTHTYRCGHALGTDEQYVVEAIRYGIKELGFSDHIFFPNLIQPGMRQNEDDYLDYVNSISNLREKYKDKIKIYIGYEAEYQNENREFLTNLLKEGKIEYLILGNHCFFENNHMHHWYASFKNDLLIMNKYFDNTIEGIKTGLFTYVAHPDIILNAYKKQDEFIHKRIIELCKVAKEYNCPLEINLAGAKRSRDPKTGEEILYPYSRFWEIVGQIGAPVVLGIDAHAPWDFMDYPLEIAEELIRKYKLKVKYKLDIANNHY